MNKRSCLKKNEPHSSSISEFIDSERRAYLRIKRFVSEYPSAVKVLNYFSKVYENVIKK